MKKSFKIVLGLISISMILYIVMFIFSFESIKNGIAIGETIHDVSKTLLFVPIFIVIGIDILYLAKTSKKSSKKLN